MFGGARGQGTVPGMTQMDELLRELGAGERAAQALAALQDRYKNAPAGRDSELIDALYKCGDHLQRCDRGAMR